MPISADSANNVAAEQTKAGSDDDSNATLTGHAPSTPEQCESGLCAKRPSRSRKSSRSRVIEMAAEAKAPYDDSTSNATHGGQNQASSEQQVVEMKRQSSRSMTRSLSSRSKDAETSTSSAQATVEQGRDEDRDEDRDDDGHREQSRSQRWVHKGRNRSSSSKRNIARKAAKTMWKGNIHPKIKDAITEKGARNHVQIIAYALMVAFFSLAMVYVYNVKRCEQVEGLIEKSTLEKDDGYKCTELLIQQVFSGQTYFETAYYYGFAVPSAWGKFEGADWTTYCSELLTLANDTVATLSKQLDSSTSGVHVGSFDYEYDTTAAAPEGPTTTCGYKVYLHRGANGYPNAPGGVRGCSYTPDSYADSPELCFQDGILVDGSDIRAWLFYSSSVSISEPFCPDFLLWDAQSARFSPMDTTNNKGPEAVKDVCSMWGQDVGIVSNAVQNCTKNICLKWWNIVGNAIAIALGVEILWIFLAIVAYKVYHKDRNSEEGGKEGGNSAFSDEGGSREEEAATREERGGVETVGRQIKVALYETCIKELRGDH